MTQIIAVAVPKGGTGKTTTTLNLGAAFAERGHRVLLIDLDPQGNLTQSLGYRPATLSHTIYTVMKHYITHFEPTLDTAILHTPAGMDLVPTSVRLNLANDELAVAMQREFVLKHVLTPIQDRYDTILIDTLPYLGVLVVNALVAATAVLMPLQAEYLATESTELLLDHVAMMRRSGLNPHLSIAGIVLTMVNERTVIHREAVEYTRTTFADRVRVFDTVIKRSIRFPESQARHQTMFAYDPKGDGTAAYRQLAQEVLNG